MEPSNVVQARFLRGKSVSLWNRPKAPFYAPFDIPYDLINAADEVIGSGVFEDCYVTSMSWPESSETMKVEEVPGLCDRVLPFVTP